MLRLTFWQQHSLWIILLTTIVGCATSDNRTVTYTQAPTQAQAPTHKKITTTEELKPSSNFHNNTGSDVAMFGINAANCYGNDGVKGVYVTRLNNTSVAKAKGLAAGDKIIQLSTFYPTSVSELTYIIQRITPDTVQSIAFERNAKKYAISVIPPSITLTTEQKQKAYTPYLPNEYPCRTINLRDAK